MKEALIKCQDCVYHESCPVTRIDIIDRLFFSSYGNEFAQCKCMKFELDEITHFHTGLSPTYKFWYCSTARKIESMCGKDARYFEQK